MKLEIIEKKLTASAEEALTIVSAFNGEGWALGTGRKDVYLLPEDKDKVKEAGWLEGAELCAGNLSLHVRLAGQGNWSVIKIKKDISGEGENTEKTFKGRNGKDPVYEIFWDEKESPIDNIKELKPTLYRFAGFKEGK